MNRRDFLTALGIGSFVAFDNITNPKNDPAVSVPPIPPSTFTGYPTPYFTGFKAPVNQQILAGQLLWAILYDTGVEENLTFWQVTCSFPYHADLKSIPALIDNSLLTCMDMIDRSMLDASQNLVTRVGSKPNPDYDPNHIHDENCPDAGYSMDWCIKEARTIPAEEKISAIRVKPVSYRDLHDLPLRISGDNIVKDYSRLWSIEYPATSYNLDLYRQAAVSLAQFPKFRR